jgi:hypothetical protein
MLRAGPASATETSPGLPSPAQQGASSPPNHPQSSSRNSHLHRLAVDAKVGYHETSEALAETTMRVGPVMLLRGPRDW